MSKIIIYKDETCELTRIELNGKEVFEGSSWDLDEDVWVYLLRELGVTVGYECE